MYLPQLWRSNLVSPRKSYVYQDWLERAKQTGERVKRTKLVGCDWRAGRLIGFHWLEDRPFEAIAIYDDRVSGENPLYVPVLWQGYFQEPVDVASLRRDMDTGLVLDERWLRLPQSQALSPDFCPGLIIFCADRASAAMARRNWQESLTKDNQTTPAIIDAQGQVVRPMGAPTALWRDFKAVPHYRRTWGTFLLFWRV